jgi:hypothetical protein
MISRSDLLHRLVAAVSGDERADYVLSGLMVDPRLARSGATASRAKFAMALNVLLFSDLLNRVPTAAAYVAHVIADGRSICFDHGALRTIDGPTGALPLGHGAFARILEPLGYRVGGVYPLAALKMTGRAFVHHDYPETVPQFFISELHIAQLPEEAQIAAERVFGSSRDPLGDVERHALDIFARNGTCPLDAAIAALPGLAAAFGCQHPTPAIADYEILRACSAEGAWMATEGNAFNHATDRIPDVTALAEKLRAAGMPLKAEVEVSANGRVRQTAFIADKVLRRFRARDGSLTERLVPGSFYEFISRDIDPATGKLDLSFDSGNATGIFAVTSPT